MKVITTVTTPRVVMLFTIMLIAKADVIDSSSIAVAPAVLSLVVVRRWDSTSGRV